MRFQSYGEFESAKLACSACPVHGCYRRVVASEGNKSDPTVIIVGEAPGKDEVEQGRPFIGPAGQVLRNGLRPLGFSPSNTLITNTIPCRPMDNQYPSDRRLVNQCMERWLLPEIDLLKPRVLLLLGAKAFSGVMGMAGITANRGRVFFLQRAGWQAKVIPTYHPSYIMRVRHTSEGAGKIREWLGDLGRAASEAGLPSRSTAT